MMHKISKGNNNIGKGKGTTKMEEIHLSARPRQTEERYLYKHKNMEGLTVLKLT